MAPIPLSPALSHEEANKLLPADNLQGKNVLITGGASGISLAIGTSFAEKGAYVTLVDINEEAGKQHAESLRARELKVQFIKADVRSWQSQVEAFKAAVKFHPDETLDIVVAGAGTFSETFVAPDEPGITSLDETPPEPPTIAWETNSIGLSFTAKLAQLYFEFTQKPASSEPKSLLLIASLAAYFDIPLMSAYTSSKYGARGLFRSIRPIFASRGHRVNLMAPWIIPTSMTVEWMKMFRAVGAPEGHVDQAVTSALRCASGKNVNGRAFCIGPHRVLDLEDDPEGWNAGKAMHEFLNNDIVGWPEQEKKMLDIMGFSE
ncbi:5'-hydroxyaverantin dehydrogenase [Lasiodiplodia hormozganensis]|uniref:5'-hydroxyaverantin dehydrogenase n=1 Tax=Lasiodiplodia hormozganensis TaxID=869390 RepID=A0AA39Z353_9PEZI|nr:5'-hydroxyaverantin dehydrogenase [Lasiodiplodia hormozganensis]